MTESHGDALHGSTNRLRIASLLPSAADIWTDISNVGEALGRSDTAQKLVFSLQARTQAIAARAGALGTRPKVLSIEWIDPVMIGGMWMPELVTLAGGEPLVTNPGEHAPTLQRDRLAALEPDVVVVKPCGFGLERTLAELDVLREALPRRWRARVYAADRNAYFYLPRPRSAE